MTARCKVGRVLRRQLEKLDVTSLTLDQGSDAGSVVHTDDEVALPMPGDCPVGRVETAIMDAAHLLGEAAPRPHWAGVRSSVVAAYS